MAEKPQEVAGINKVIAELKKLNKASAKDMLREREAQQHAEKIALGQEVQEEQGSSMISAGEAFQRRFLAGQAKTIADQKMQDEGSRYSTQQEIGSDTKKILEAVDKIYGIFEKKKGDEEEEKREKDKDKKDKKKDKSEASKSSFLGKAAKGAAGMGLMGLGIGAFMSGLMVWSNVKAFRGENFPEQAKNISEGWEHFGSMSTTSIATLGVMLAGGAFLGMVGGVGKASKAALGMTAMGAGIGGFMSGIAAAGSLTGFDGTTFKDNAADLAEALENLGKVSDAQMITLGVIAAGGAVLSGKKGILLASKAATGAALGGAAIGGFMSGIAAAGSITKFTGSEFKDQAVNTVAALKELESLNAVTLTTLGIIVAGGVALTMGKGPAGKGGIRAAATAALGASIMGAGIGGFMVGISAASKLGSLVGADGAAFKEQASNIAAGMGAFTEKQQLALAGFIGAGAILGPVGSGIAAAGMTAMGAGIGGFFSGMAGIGAIMKAIGVDGTGLKDIMSNMAEGMNAYNDVDGGNLMRVGGGMAKLGLGLAELMAVTALTEGVDKAQDAWQGLKNFVLFWKDDVDTGETGMAKLILGIVEPMKRLGTDINPTEMDAAAAGIESVVKVLNSYNKLGNMSAGPNFSDLAEDFAWGAQAIDAAMSGGTFTKGKNIKIKTGLKDLTSFQFDTVSAGINALQHAMFNYNLGGGANGGGGNVTNNTDASSQYNIFTAPEVIDMGAYAWPGGNAAQPGGASMYQLWASQN